jgi:uncharacterized membrane protein YccF (DUF307 family)
MTIIGNILWLVLAGWWLSLAYVIAGIVNLLPIITIPLAIQSFKLAGYALWPFGRVVVDIPNRSGGLSFLANVIWFFLGGMWLALAHVIAGVLLMLTIIGIPLGVASFKMAGLALAPFGRTVVDARLARPEQVVVAAEPLGHA